MTEIPEQPQMVQEQTVREVRGFGFMSLATSIVALQLVPLHQVDGRAVWVNPSEITAFATPRGEERLGSPATACMVFMTDRTHWQVLETCSAIRQLIEK